MNKILRSLALSLSIFSALCASAWSQKGHDVTAYIAEQHLTPRTAQAVNTILDGKSLVYWANWLDNASHTSDYYYTSTWHYINVDADQTYETAPRNTRGDVVTAMRQMIGKLYDPHTSMADKQLALKILTHITGDLHQPLHTGHKSDLGGNKIDVKFFNYDNNLHAVWDGSLPDATHKWSYTEWQQQIDRATPAEETVIISGNIDDWAKQSMAIAAEIYEYFPADSKISYNEIAHWAPTVEEQYLKGGLRLAHILNLIFDPDYAPGTLITAPTDL